MGNLLLSVYKELSKNNPYAHEYMETVLESVKIEKKLSKLTAVIHSSRLLSFDAIEYFALFLSQKYPRFSIDVSNMFNKDNLTEKDFPTLFRLYSESVRAIPTIFFDDAEVTLEDKSITINISTKLLFTFLLVTILFSQTLYV